MKRILLIICFLTSFFWQQNAFAQDNNQLRKENTIEQKIESIVESLEDENIDYTQIFDELLYYVDHPLNLNRATKKDLQVIYVLNEFQINNLLKYREKNGSLMTAEELQAIEGFNAETIQKLLLFAEVKSDVDTPRLNPREVLKEGNHQLIIRNSRVLEEQKGFTDADDSTLAANPNARYLGSKDRLYARYRFNYSSKLAWGFTAEKDAGEEFFRGSQPNGFDFYSAHLFLRNMGNLKALAIGDYQAQFGQGLAFWSGLAFGKSAFITNVKRNAPGLRASTSVDENRFLRGAGATFKFGNVELTAFGSYKKVDGNLQTPVQNDTVDTEEERVFSSLLLSGFHRTPNELKNKNAIQETIYGGRMAYVKNNFTIGITGARTQYDAKLNRRLSFYNQYDFVGDNLSNIGIDYNYIYQNFNFFGEYATSDNGAFATVHGLIASLDPRVTLTFLYRNYQKDYQSLNAAGVGEQANTRNEKGMLLGLDIRPNQKWTITSYYDRFVFPWMRFRTDAPSHGVDMFAQASYRPNKKVELYGRVRSRNRFRNSSEDIDEIEYIVANHQTNYRLNLSYDISPSFKIRNRVEMINFKLGDSRNEKGYLIYQDVIYKALNSPLTFSFRYAIFDAESFDARLYAYENDVLYFFSIPAFFGRGTRTYITAKYTVSRKVDVWLRLSQTYYYDRDEIGSGLDLIEGNTRSEVRVQLRYKF
jgi:hypothetical protein